MEHCAEPFKIHMRLSKGNLRKKFIRNLYFRQVSQCEQSNEVFFNSCLVE